MKIRTFKYKAITITLILSFLSIGVVHAETLCDGSCKCHLRGPRGRVPLGFSATSSGSLHRGTGIHLLQDLKHSAEIDFLHAGCHEGPKKLSCDMEAARDRYALQRLLTAVPCSQNSSNVDPILFLSAIYPNKEHAPGPALSRRLIDKKVPDPLYLQHLPLVC